jgi:competence protein ComEA
VAQLAGGIVIVGCLGAGVGLAYPLVQRPAAPPVQLVATPPAPTAAPTALAEIQVHVTGAVQQPGLYALPAGSRVGDAVQAAGPADDADPDALNLAARLADGQRLVVPHQGEPPPAALPESAAAASAPAASRAASNSAASRAASAPSAGAAAPGAASAPGGKVNLNTATAAQLDALPGIGPAYAKRILDYRERNGPYRSAQQLRDARLVPNATFDRIKDLVTVE